MSIQHFFKPARAQAQPPKSMKIICDFDALDEQQIGFIFKGKGYVIKSLTVENFKNVTLAYNRFIDVVNKRSQGEDLPSDTVYESYYDLIKEVVPDFKYADLVGLDFNKLKQLMCLVLRTVGGDPTLYESGDQKKNLFKLQS